jgi:AcrR family transcriptional regulator
MVERVNRREQIIETAAQLFMEKGYTATSVREITDEVGCTEAALYYHFKDGKRELLGAVCESFAPDFMDIIESCRDAESISDFVMRFGMAGAERFTAEKNERMRWIIGDFPRFTEEEKAVFHSKHKQFHAGLREILERLIGDPEKAEKAAWLVFCTGFGYGQLFLNLELGNQVDFTPVDLMSILGEGLRCLYE